MTVSESPRPQTVLRKLYIWDSADQYRIFVGVSFSTVRPPNIFLLMLPRSYYLTVSRVTVLVASVVLVQSRFLPQFFERALSISMQASCMLLLHASLIFILLRQICSITLNFRVVIKYESQSLFTFLKNSK